MRNPHNARPLVRLALAALLLPAALAPAPPAFAQKMSPEDVVARHLESIGAAADRAAVTSRLMQGVAAYTLRSPGQGRVVGPVLMFSEGNKSAVAMNFGSPDYSSDKFGYDGDKLYVAYVKPGVRSQLGDFIWNRKLLFEHGLLGGTLASTWPLLNMANKNAKLEYAGTDKHEGRQVHKLRYVPRKGADLKITFFFDAENFRHLRTEYEQTVSNQMTTTAPGGSREGSRELERELRYRMVEDFADFKQVNKLTLPHTYKLYLSMDRRLGGTYIGEWEMRFDKFGFNQQLDPKWFDVTASE